MKINPECGLSFKAWFAVTTLLEFLFSAVIILLSIWILIFRLGSDNIQFLYSPTKNTSSVEKNKHYEYAVTSWILVVLLCLCAIRIISACLLSIGVKKSTPEVARLWIAFKVFLVMISAFLLTASFTVGLFVKVTALISTVGDLLTSYFVRVLYPELDKMRRFIKVVDEKEKKEAPSSEA